MEPTRMPTESHSPELADNENPDTDQRKANIAGKTRALMQKMDGPLNSTAGFINPYSIQLSYERFDWH